MACQSCLAKLWASAFIKNDGHGGNTLSKVQEDYDCIRKG